MSKPAELPNDIEALKALLAASEDRNLRKQDRIDQLEKLVADFKRALFGATCGPRRGFVGRVGRRRRS